MNIKEAESMLEAILFGSGDPVPADKLCAVMKVDEDTLVSIARRLSDEYDLNRRGIMLLKLGKGYQLASRPEYGELVRAAIETRRPPSLSQAALEVLSIAAYKQPITRAYIEQVRGVDSSYTVTSLLEKKLLCEAGRLDVPGRPRLFRTTDVFLRTFGLSSLSDLPDLPVFDTAAGEQLTLAEVTE